MTEENSPVFLIGNDISSKAYVFPINASAAQVLAAENPSFRQVSTLLDPLEVGDIVGMDEGEFFITRDQDAEGQYRTILEVVKDGKIIIFEADEEFFTDNVIDNDELNSFFNPEPDGAAEGEDSSEVDSNDEADTG